MTNSRHDAMRMDIGRLRFDYGVHEGEVAPSSPLMASPLASPISSPKRGYNAPALTLGAGIQDTPDLTSGSPPSSPLRGSPPTYHAASASPPRSASIHSSASPVHHLQGRFPTSSISPTMAARGSGGTPTHRGGTSTLLENPGFLDWLFLALGTPHEDLDRITKLEAMLGHLQQLGAATIVLTNGFAPDVACALRNLGLAQYFVTVCDTRGTAVCDPGAPSAKEERVHVGGGMGRRYSKSSFVSGCVFRPEEAGRLFKASEISHVVYVDDDAEPLEPSRSQTIRLPKEGPGITDAVIGQVLTAATEATSQANHGQVLVAFDFDCTLSARHMFKAMHQPSSHWAREWDAFNARAGGEQAQRTSGDVAEKPI